MTPTRAAAVIPLLAVVLAGCATASEEAAPGDDATSLATPGSTPAEEMTPPATPADDVTQVLVAGDSLSEGMFASVKANGFAQLVVDHLEPAELTLAARAHETLAVVSSYTEVPADVDVAIIELGTNDVGIPTPDDEFRDGYTALVTAIRETSPDAKLVCLGTWTGWGWTQDRTILSTCEAAGGSYVHLRDLFDEDRLRGPAGVRTSTGVSDWFHPNDEGHAAIASRIIAALDEMSLPTT